MPHRKAVENKSAPENLCTIGKVARAAAEKSGLRCTPTMIYNYERLGLLSPPKKTEGGTRLYDDQDLDRLVLLKKLQREFGGSLDEVKAILAEIGDPGALLRDRKGFQAFLLEKKRIGGNRNKKFVESKEARRFQMINSALDLFEKKGYHQTTIADITSASGTSHGTFYLYFRDKDALIQEIVETVMEATWKAVEEARNQGALSWDRVWAMIESFFQIDKRYQRMAHSFAQGAGRDTRAYDKRVEEVYRKVSAPFVTEIERGIRSGEFHCRDARGAAFEIISLVELFRYRSIHRERFVFEKFGQTLEGSREGRHMELLRIVVDEILNPAGRPGPARGTAR